MTMQLNLTSHVITQLKQRYPNYTNAKLLTALEGAPTFIANGQKHTYLGTGFDLYGENRTKKSQLRKRIQRRHLFLVSKQRDDGQWVQVTAVYHTTKSILKWLNMQDAKILRSDIIPEEIQLDEIIQIDGATVGIYRQQPLSLRTDIWWSYGTFNIIVNYYM